MTNRKNHNSIIFLTTLSVYLSLVLVGGVSVTPQVLAHSALTRNFEIQTEIEVKDDLDKKPDDDEKINFVDSVEDYLNDVQTFVSDLQKLRGVETFHPNFDKFEVSSRINIACNIKGDPAATSTLSSRNFGNRPLESSIEDASLAFSGWEFLSDCLKDEKGENSFSTSSKSRLFYDNDELRIEVSAPKLTRQRADFLAESLSRAYTNYRIDERQRSVVKTIYENTSIKSENNQVFIVTRLPRGSIDSLLASNVK